MAIGATAQWEVRANAANSGLQGGFYVSTAGSTDYSQQDTAQLSLTDIATDGAGTGLSSATGGFTSAMIGNGIYITGGGTTAGWYQITARASSNAITIDRSCGASKTNVTGRVGGATIFADTPLEAVVAGNTVWVKSDGTHTLSNIVSMATGIGTEALPLIYRGYKTTHGDNPDGDDRPLLACGTYYFYPGNYTRVYGFRMTGTAVVVTGTFWSNVLQNCKVENTSATANRAGIYTNNNGGMIIDCEATSTAGYAIQLNHSTCLVLNSYVHDTGVVGIYIVTNGYCTVIGSIADTCVTGINLTATVGNKIINNTIHGNTTAGISSTTSAEHNTFINNAITGNGKGITIAANHDGENYGDYNNYYDNTTDRENISVGDNDIALDPQYTDADGGDFSIAAGSNMANKASTIRLGV